MARDELLKELAVQDTDFQDNLRSIELYHAFIAKMLPKFMLKLNMVNEIIKRLKAEGKISKNVQLGARIKSQESARTKTSKKGVISDIFGMEVIMENIQEREFISKEIENLFLNPVEEGTTVNVNEKYITKESGYIAFHQKFDFFGEQYKTVELPVKSKLDTMKVNVIITPTMEVQYKTTVVKNITQNDRYHTEDRGITRNQIRKLAAANAFYRGVSIPRMWATDEEGNLYELSKDQVLKKMYPFLNDESDNPRRKGVDR